MALERCYLLPAERIFGFADDMDLNLVRITRLIRILPVFGWFGEFSNLHLRRLKAVWLIAGYLFARDVNRWFEWARVHGWENLPRVSKAKYLGTLQGPKVHRSEHWVDTFGKFFRELLRWKQRSVSPGFRILITNIFLFSLFELWAVTASTCRWAGPSWSWQVHCGS